jgi:uncharacterized protein (DUF58 family)
LSGAPGAGTPCALADAVRPADLLVGAGVGLTAVAWLLALAAAAWLGVSAFVRLAPRGFAYRRRVHPGRLFPGQRADLVVEAENRKRLPLPWMVVHDVLPQGLAVPEAPPTPGWLGRGERLTLSWRLAGHERRRRRLRLEAVQRGAHRIGPARLWWSDPLGWREDMADLPGSVEVLVYPRLVPFEEWRFGGETPLGPRPRAGWLHQDPLQVVGARPYRQGDPFRQIHWGATARTGSLQVRQTVPAHHPAAALFVDAGAALGGPAGSRFDPLPAEAALSLGATLAVRILADGRGALACFCQSASLPAASGTAHLRRMLEILARASALAPHRLAALLAREVPRLPPETRLLVVTPWAGPDVVAVLTRLRRPAELFVLGSAPPGRLPPTVRVHPIPYQRLRSWFS